MMIRERGGGGERGGGERGTGGATPSRITGDDGDDDDDDDEDDDAGRVIRYEEVVADSLQLPSAKSLSLSSSFRKGGTTFLSPSSASNSAFACVAALCFCMLTHSYLLISVFPYSGYLAIALLDNKNNNVDNRGDAVGVGVTKDSAGLYAGWLASAFMAGRAFTSYSWGQAADTYGRKWVLIVSLLLSSVLSLAFGLASTNYTVAITIRFIMGAANGLVGSIKSIVSEMAPSQAVFLQGETADAAAAAVTTSSATMSSTTLTASQKKKVEQWEQRTMGLVLGLWGWGFLFSPAVSGALSDPLRQYPDLVVDGSWIHTLLERYPFILPNLLGTLLCLMSTVVISLFVQETLQMNRQQKQQSELLPLLLRVKTIILQSLTFCLETTRRLLCRCCFGSGSISVVSNRDLYKNITILKEKTSFLDGCSDDDLPAHGNRITDGSSSSSIECDDENTNNQKNEETRIQFHLGGRKKESLEHQKSGFLSIWWSLPPVTRNSLLIYWVYSFIGTAIDETFPLFCLSEKAGFGLSELGIGKMLSLCGLMFAVSQYGVNEIIYRRLGQLGSIRAGTVLAGPMLLLIPLSKLLNSNNSNINNKISIDNDTSGHLNRKTFLFLSIIMAIYRLFALVFFTNISVLINRSVPMAQRATINGLSIVGMSFSQALGPVFAGFLVSWSVAVFQSAASIFIFGMLAGFSFCLATTTFYVLVGEDDGKGNEIEENGEEELERLLRPGYDACER